MKVGDVSCKECIGSQHGEPAQPILRLGSDRATFKRLVEDTASHQLSLSERQETFEGLTPRLLLNQ